MTNQNYTNAVELAKLEQRIEKETGCKLEVETYTYNDLKTLNLNYNGKILICETSIDKTKTISESIMFKGYTHFLNEKACEDEFNRELAEYRKIKRITEAFMLTR